MGAWVYARALKLLDLSDCTTMYYVDLVYEDADWSHRGDYIVQRHDVVPAEANEALLDPERMVIEPDYNSASGRSVRIIGYSTTADDLITVIVLIDDGVTYGVNAWRSNARDRQIYREGEL